MKIKILNNLCELATDCKFWSQKNSIFSGYENVVFVLVYAPYIWRCKREFGKYVRGFYSF